MDELKKYIKTDKLLLGTKQSIKAIRAEKVNQVFLANNCPQMVKEDVKRYAEMVNIPVEELDIACDDLGALVKKPFLVSVVSILK